MKNKPINHRKKTQAISSIWAVAKNTIKQALRMKAAVVFIILLFVLLPILGLTTTGDETLKGRLQTFVSYGLSLTSLLLCLLTIIISIYTITHDIKYKQIHSVITKPIRRYQLLLGKMLGVMVLDAVLLCLFSATIYLLAIYLPVFFDATQEELVQLSNEFFTARAALSMPEEDVTEQVEKRYAELESIDRLPQGFTREQIINELTNQEQLVNRSVDVGHALVWEFSEVKPLTENLFIRFKYDVSSDVSVLDMEIIGEWIVGDPRYFQSGEKITTPIYDEIHTNSIQTFHEIEIPVEVIPEDGRLAVAFINYPLNSTSVIFPADGLGVLYKAGSFTANFIRAVLLISFRLIFLASLGTLTSTFVSFPVAILVCLVVFFTASVSGFIIESFSYLSENVSTIYTYTIELIVQLLPQFDKFNPTKFIIESRLLSWFLLAKCAIVMLCIQSFILLILSFAVFSRREIAKIIV